MKKHLLTLSLVILFTVAYSQKALQHLIKSDDGTSTRFITLPEAEQITFNPQQVKTLLNLDAASDLVIQRKESDLLGYTHYRYYQSYKGIPVENSMYIIHVKAGKLSAVNGEIITDFDNSGTVQSTAALTTNQALKSAVNYVDAIKYAWQDAEMESALKSQMGDKKASYYPVPNLVWFSDVEGINPRELRLAYKIDIYARIPLSRAYYFVDAKTGKVLGKKDLIHFTDATGTANTAYSGSQTIHSDLNSGSYRLRDLTKGNGIITLHGESGQKGNNYTSTSANWNLTGTNQAAMDAHYGVSKTYEFYKTNFNRNSYDGNGTALTSYVNDPTYTDNAYWDGTAMNFCKRSNSASYPGGVTGIDVTGHELTHGFTQATSNLTYSKEPGAINESMSDIMGKSVQFWAKPTDINWQLSNDMNWIIRNMANPNAEGQPDTYKGTYWVTSSSDNYGVHTNSGVGNFMFYLLVTGGSGTNDLGNAYSVSGIGLAKADQILYRTNTTYLTSSSQYAQWRTACISAATDLYGATSNEVIQVQNAWYAVGVGSAPVICSTPATPNGLTATAITGTSATLSWTSTSVQSYNLQWKASSASTFTTVSGITATSYNLTGLTANTSYQFKVQSVCNGTAGSYSTLYTFSTTATTISYCASKGNSTSYEYINKVALGTINNTSANNNGYGNYTSLSTNLTTGVANSIVLTPGFTSSAYTEYWSVFIDYNKDGDFTDAGEAVTTGSGSGAVTKSFTVPATAKNGATRMRIQMKYGSPASTNSCATLTYGEVEDYTVNISGGTIVAFLVSSDEIKLPRIKISPNPVVASFATVYYTLVKDGKVSLRISDMYGRLVQTISRGSQAKGDYSFTLNTVKKLAAGNYIIGIQQADAVIGKVSFVVAR